MVGLEVIHIAIAPPDQLDAEFIGKVAAFIDKDSYNTRLLMAGKIPKIIAHSNSREQAESIAQNLRTLGLTVLVFEDTALRRQADCFRAYNAEFGQGEILFFNRSGQKIKMGTESTYLIIKGIISVHKETESTSTKMKLNVPLTALAGGIPIVRTVKESTKESSSREEYFLRFYDGKSDDPGAEIFQTDFNYSNLGSQKGSSSQVNFNILVANIIKAFPRAIIDDRLTKYRSTDSAANTLNTIEINCRLIYSFYRATNPLSA